MKIRIRRRVVVAMLVPLIAGLLAGQSSVTAASARSVVGLVAAPSGEVPAPPTPPAGAYSLPKGESIAGLRGEVAALQAHAVAGEHADVADALPTMTLPPQAHVWGQATGTRALVLYDSTGPYGYLGAEYATFAGNLATAFGSVVAEPVVDYLSGQVSASTAVIYIGSTYNEPIPPTFLADVLATTKPVIWMYDNIWQLAMADGEVAFTSKFGWDAAQSYFALDRVFTITYKKHAMTRSSLNAGGIMGEDITAPSQVTQLAQAICETTCSSLARSTTGKSFPWAVRSKNLTYIGEIPFSYVNETDRSMIFSDLIFDALAPATATKHRALVRIEDVNPTTPPSQIRAIATYLHSVNVPFSIGVIPEYTDPNGYDNHHVAKTLTLANVPNLVSALKFAQTEGATLIEHGYTHQYSNVDNPYDAVTADDFEFFRSQCSTTAVPPYNFFAPCGDTGYVIEEGPLPGDSANWAAGRVATGRGLFAAAKLSVPTIWETPHYAASAADYSGIDRYFSVRYERDLFFQGQLDGASGSNTPASPSYGQFFPYVVHDLYGTEVLPENLGDYEPTPYNGNPARLSAALVAAAYDNLVVRDGFASFFIHPYDPMSALEATVTGIQKDGYTFVSLASVEKSPL